MSSLRADETWSRGQTAMNAIPQFSEIDLVDVTLSPRRQWICKQLATLLPNNVIKVASNDPHTKVFFETWTGQSQKNLETAWENEGFK
jgi:hypothetical protein